MQPFFSHIESLAWDTLEKDDSTIFLCVAMINQTNDPQPSSSSSRRRFFLFFFYISRAIAPIAIHVYITYTHTLVVFPLAF